MYKLPENLDSKYKFVTLAAKRAEQLQSGAPPRVDEPARKMTVIAQAEVAEGFVTVWDPEVDAVPEGAEDAEEE